MTQQQDITEVTRIYSSVVWVSEWVPKINSALFWTTLNTSSFPAPAALNSLVMTWLTNSNSGKDRTGRECSDYTHRTGEVDGCKYCNEAEISLRKGRVEVWVKLFYYHLLPRRTLLPLPAQRHFHAINLHTNGYYDYQVARGVGGIYGRIVFPLSQLISLLICHVVIHLSLAKQAPKGLRISFDLHFANDDMI